jgi:F-type H+-transporting ATPase subunit delta
MPNPRLAGRYAKSILDLSIEKNLLDAVFNDMVFLDGICHSSRELVNFLRSPIVQPEKKEKTLGAITGAHVGVLTAAFIRLLVTKGREPLLPEIAVAFIQQYKKHKDIHIVKLITAIPASDELKNNIIDKVKSALNMEHIELQESVEPEIIGGFILEIGDKLVDASVAYDLRLIKKEFEDNDFVYRIR